MTHAGIAGGATGPTKKATQIVTFYSYKGGTGRTMAVANVAWTLANCGFRVLVVDWDLESPGLHRYFRPFLTDRDLTGSDGVIDMLLRFVNEQGLPVDPADPEATDPLRHADFSDNIETLGWPHFPRGGRVDFLGPGRQEPRDGQGTYESLYELNVSTFPWAQLFDGVDENAFVGRLRENMLSAGYDYVLVDSRTGVSDASGICTMRLPDIVVIGFVLNNQSIEGGAWVARLIRSGAQRPVRVIPVPMRVEDGEQSRLETRRMLAAYKFREVLADHAPDSDGQVRRLAELEIPYKRLYAYEELLAAFGDTPGARSNLLAAYEGLARAIHGPDLPEPASVPYKVRQRIAAQFERADAPALRRAAVVAVAEDRAWQDWVTDQLRRAGIEVPAPRSRVLADDLAAAEALVVIVSPALVADPAVTETISSHLADRAGDARPAERRVTLVEVAPVETVSFPGYSETVRLGGHSEMTARERLLDHFGFVNLATADGDGDTARFPGRKPTVWRGVPRRNGWFVGRAGELQPMRDTLTPGSSETATCVLQGQRGIGKSQIAAEYAHRFRADYDLVWWISAQDGLSIRRSLARLAERLGLDAAAQVAAGGSEGSLPELATAALDALRRGEPYRRWLLIFDNAGQPDAVEDLIPECTPFGHVVITSFHPRWADQPSYSVGTFPRADSVALLRHGRPDAGDDDLADIADQVGDFPFDLQQAASALGRSTLPAADAVSEYLTRLKERGSWSGGSTWAMEFAELRSRPDALSQMAVRLLEMCSFLAEEGISLRLVNSASMAARLVDPPGGPVVGAGGADVDDVLQHIERINLASIDQTRDRLVVHGRSQQFIREQLTPARAAEVRSEVWRVLAAYASTSSADDSGGRTRLTELQRHIRAAQAPQSHDHDVRRWMIFQVHSMWRSGEWQDALDLSEQCLTNWAVLGPEDAVSLQMATWRANVLRRTGRIDEAFELDERTLAVQRQVHGLEDRRTLLTAGSFGADKRVLGWYNDARAEDQATYDIYRRVYGTTDRGAMDAGNNLALAQYLDGDVAAALATSRAVLADRTSALGPGLADMWWSQCLVGICLRELGEVDEAWGLMSEAHERLKALDGPASPLTLDAGRQLAVTLRRKNDAQAARALTNQVLGLYERRYPADDLGRLTCQLNLALDLHTIGRRADAVRTAASCLPGYEQRCGNDEHPVLNAARTNIAICRLGAGEVPAALQLAATSHQLLREQLYEYHPHVLAAAINLANCLLAAGRTDEARMLDEEIHRECSTSLGTDHPQTRIARFHHSGELSGDLGQPGLPAGPGVLAERRSADVDILIN